MSAAFALALLLIHLVLVFGVQELAQRRRSGRSSWVSTQAKSPTERAADALFVVGLVLACASPILVLTGVLAPPFERPFAAAALVAVATILARRAQRDMGAAWRTGVAGEPSVDLVEHGAFRLVRNPVYTALVLALGGVALAAPTAVAVAAVLVFAGGLQVQTRAVEEPHLSASHGEAYARRVGRFLPFVGRLR